MALSSEKTRAHVTTIVTARDLFMHTFSNGVPPNNERRLQEIIGGSEKGLISNIFMYFFNDLFGYVFYDQNAAFFQLCVPDLCVEEKPCTYSLL